MQLPLSRAKWFLQQYQAVKLVGLATLQDEPSLMLLKWPGYRFMTPIAATRLFASEYRTAYRACLRANVDIEAAERSTVGKKINFRAASGQVTQYWKARQKADAMGIPYRDYLDFCFSFAMNRKRKQLPQPNQLTGGEGAARETWSSMFEDFWNKDRRVTALMRMDFMPQYQVPDGHSLPARQTFVETLIKLHPHAGSQETFLGNFLIERGYLQREDLLASMDEEQADKLIARAQAFDSWSRLTKPVGPTDLFQSCFGLPQRAVSEAEVCQYCPVRDACRSERQIVTRWLVDKTGTADPFRAEENRKNREYVAKSRAKARALSAVPAGT